MGTIADLQRLIEKNAPVRGDTPELPPACAHCPSRVYFIQAGESGPIKIGVARDVAARRTSHQTSNHEPLRILADVPGTTEHEMYLHRFFNAEHRRGEWFDPSPRLLAYIASLAQR